MITLSDIKTFLSLCETENFNITAENLNITQSTVSSRIAKLEDYLGVELFRRGKFGAKITATGELFKPQALRMLKVWEESIDFVKPSRKKEKNINISIQFSLGRDLITPLIQHIEEQLPHLFIYAEPNYATTSLKLLDNNETDFAIIYKLEQKHHKNTKEYEMIKIAQEQFIMVSPQQDCDYRKNKHIFINWCDGFKNSYAKNVWNMRYNSVSFGYSNIALEYLKKVGGTMYIPKRFLNSAELNYLHPVKDAPIIKQDIVVLFHRHSNLKNECKTLAEIVKNLI